MKHKFLSFFEVENEKSLLEEKDLVEIFNNNLVIGNSMYFKKIIASTTGSG